jgi:hypothetical protein
MEGATPDGLNKYFKADPKFRVCVVSQSSNRVDSLYNEIREEFPI